MLGEGMVKAANTWSRPAQFFLISPSGK